MLLRDKQGAGSAYIKPNVRFLLYSSESLESGIGKFSNTIGDYKLKENIGDCGLTAIYEAGDKLGRDVAVLRSLMDTHAPSLAFHLEARVMPRQASAE